MYTQTKRFILFIYLLSLCFASCKKNNDGGSASTGTISTNIDGVATTFNHGAKATILSVSGGYGISIQGNKKDPSESQTSILFSIASPTPITKGTYSENAGGNPLVIMTYLYNFAFDIVYTSSTYGSTTRPVSITITDISNTSVKGTFSGELYSPEGPSGSPYKTVITNGSFNVRF